MIEIDDIEVIKNPDTNFEYNFDIKIKTWDSAILIWNHWKTLEDLKNILRLVINNNFEEKIWINIEINDYLEKKFDKLLAFISKKIDFVKRTWKEVVLPFYNGFERKKIHSYVASLEDCVVETKSIWEWKDRRMHLILKEWIKPSWNFTEKETKKISISIDLDWVWI
jgi:predicted RNA-binding protein Jag